MDFFGNERTNKLYSGLYPHKDLVVSCQYPHKIKVEEYSVPCVNIHYGILPHFRGVAPIYHQLMNGSIAGVTLHYMDAEFDTGDIIEIYSFPTHGMTADEVYDECEKRGMELLSQNVGRICDNYAPRTKQGNGTYYKGGVDFDRQKRIEGVFFDPRQIRRVFATHFKGKQYPVINIGGRDFELRAI